MSHHCLGIKKPNLTDIKGLVLATESDRAELSLTSADYISATLATQAATLLRQTLQLKGGSFQGRWRTLMNPSLAFRQAVPLCYPPPAGLALP